MRNFLLLFPFTFYLFTCFSFAQSNPPSNTNIWETQYVTLDDATSGTGDQTASVAVIGPDRFVALVSETPNDPNDIFTLPGNYLVGYWDADSALGRVPSPINGQVIEPDYGGTGDFTDWESGLELITFSGAWQIASGGPDNYIYVANNDLDHSILVFELTSAGVAATTYAMYTGTENIYAIEVDNSGYVYVADYQGTAGKTNEVKIYAPIGTPGTNWDTPFVHSDPPVSVIDLPAGTYKGLTVSGDGTQVFVSQTNDYRIWKFTGDPTTGYTLDNGFNRQLTESDTIPNGLGLGDRVSYLGLAYLNDPPNLFAAVDSFIFQGGLGGYPFGQMHRIHPATGTVLDTIDIAQWNFERTNSFSTGSSNGRVGGFTSVLDVDIDETDQAAYTQSYYGWAVEKWIAIDPPIVGVEPVSAAVPANFQLRQNYPNPFNPSTTIAFDLNDASYVTLEVYNLIGQKVRTLVNEQLAPGSYQTVFEAGSLPSGVYFYQLTAGEYTATQSMSLTR